MESGRLSTLPSPPLDRALRAVFAPRTGPQAIARPRRPGATPGRALRYGARGHRAALMRVNHAGELAAQALYHGQALVARSAGHAPAAAGSRAHAESDHLAWCETRLQELGARPSLLNPLWYAGSFAIGALAALAGRSREPRVRRRDRAPGRGASR